MKVSFISSLDTMWLDSEINHAREYLRDFTHRETEFTITKNPYSFSAVVNNEQLWASSEADLLKRLGAYLQYHQEK